MEQKSKVFSKFISFFLVLIIIGGVGFLGYNLLSGSGGMNMTSMNMTTDDSNKKDTTTNSNPADSSSKNTMNMDMNSSNTNTATNSNATNAQYSTEVINAVLQNKDNVEKIIIALNDSLKLMTLDPYGIANNQQNGVNSTVNQTQQNNGQNQPATNGTVSQAGTTVNVFPQNGAGQVGTMQSMGTTYDASKMEKIHTGLYKVSLGVQLLDQLKNNLSAQLEQASMEVNNPSQYYYNQYLITVQNKTKLTEALAYINEASTLVNINPYVSQNGSVYDKQRMSQIHDSIYKLAQVVVDLNKINDNFSKQAITLSNVTQNYINNAQSMGNMDMTNMNTNFFGNISMVTVLNILVVAFIVIFVVSIFGYISKLFKSPKDTEF